MIKCEHCGREFARETGLKNHQRDIKKKNSCGKYQRQIIKCPNPKNNQKCLGSLYENTKHGLCRSCSAKENHKSVYGPGRSFDQVHGQIRAAELRKVFAINSKRYRDQNPDFLRGANNPNYQKPLSFERKQYLSKCAAEQWNRLSDQAKEEKRQMAMTIFNNQSVKDKSAAGRIKYLKSSNKKDTIPEQVFEQYLIGLNIEFEKQISAGYYLFDFYLTRFDIFIEIDGDYWHANPNKYDILNATQKANVKRDKCKNTYMQNKNKILIRFWESDIKNNKEFVITRLNEVIQYKCLIESLSI